MNGAGGHLIIESIPDENAKQALIAFLSRIWKDRTEDDIAGLLSNLPVSIPAKTPAEKGELLAKRIEATGVRARFVAAAKSPESTERNVPGPATLISAGGSVPTKKEASPSALPTSGVTPGAEFKRGAPKSGRLRIGLLCTLLGLLAVFWGYRIFEDHFPGKAGEKYARKPLKLAHSLKRAAGASVNTLPMDPRVETKGYAEINGIRYGLIQLNTKWIEALYSRKDFDAVESHLSALLSARENSAAMFELYTLCGNLSRIHRGDDSDHMKDVLDEWCSSRPKSHFPWLIRGSFEIERAWRARTSKLARDVPKEAWPVFHGLLEKAGEYLVKSYELNPGDPNSSTYLMTVARGLSYPREELERYYDNALNACPWHYGARILKAEYLKPKWHGSNEELFEFVEECMSRFGDDPVMGFPLVDAYSELHDELRKQENVLGAGDVWPVVQTVYENFFEKYPNDIRRRYYYSYYACKAGKYDIAYDQFEIVGDRWLGNQPWDSLKIYNQNRAYAHCVKGRNLVKTGNFAAAEPFLESSLKYNESPEAYYLLSMCYMQGYDKRDMSALRKSEAALAKALKLEPGDKHLSALMKKTQDLLRENGGGAK